MKRIHSFLKRIEVGKLKRIFALVNRKDVGKIGKLKKFMFSHGREKQKSKIHGLPNKSEVGKLKLFFESLKI